MQSVPVQLQVYWSGEDTNSHTPLVQGLSATHMSFNSQLHMAEFRVYPSAQSVSPQANGENSDNTE